MPHPRQCAHGRWSVKHLISLSSKTWPGLMLRKTDEHGRCGSTHSFSNIAFRHPCSGLDALTHCFYCAQQRTTTLHRSTAVCDVTRVLSCYRLETVLRLQECSCPLHHACHGSFSLERRKKLKSSPCSHIHVLWNHLKLFHFILSGCKHKINDLHTLAAELPGCG